MAFDVEGAIKAGAEPAQIAEFLASKVGFDLEGARKAGASDEQIVGFLKDHDGLGKPKPAEGEKSTWDTVKSAVKTAWDLRPTPDNTARLIVKNSDQNTPILAPLRRGVAQAGAGSADTMDLVGPGAGDEIRKSLNQSDLRAETAMSRLTNKIKAGNYLSAATEVPSAVLEGAPALAASYFGGIPAAVAVGALTTAGPIAKRRAELDGRKEPNATDAIIGTLAGGGGNALNLAGLNRAIPGSATSVLARLGLHTAGDVGQNVVQHTAENAGTQNGTLTPDPAEVAANAVTGAATRTALGGARKVGDSAGLAPPEVQAAQRAKVAADYEALDPAAKQRLVDSAAAAKSLNDVKTDSINRDAQHVPDNVAARTAADDIVRHVDTLLGTLESGNVLAPGDSKAIRSMFADARSQQRTLGPGWKEAITGEPSRDPESKPLLPKVQETVRDLPLSPEDKATLFDAARQVDLLSDAGVSKRNRSLVEKFTGAVGALGGAMVGGATTGHPLVAAGLGHTAGSAVGRSLAQSLGLTAPHLISDAQKATAMLDAAGVAIPDTKGDLLKASREIRDVMETQARLMGLSLQDLKNGTPEKQAADREKMNRQASADFAAAAERDQATVDKSQTKTADEVSKQRDQAYQELQRQRDAAEGKTGEVDSAYAAVEAQKRAQEEAAWASQGVADAGNSKRALAIGMDQNRAHLNEMSAIDRQKNQEITAEQRLRDSVAADFASAVEKDQASLARGAEKNAAQVERQREAAYKEIARRRLQEESNQAATEAGHAANEKKTQSAVESQIDAMWKAHEAEATGEAKQTTADDARAKRIGDDQARAYQSDVERRAEDRERSLNLTERAADKVSGMVHRMEKSRQGSEGPTEAPVPGSGPPVANPERATTQTANPKAATVPKAPSETPGDGFTIRDRTNASRGAQNPLKELVPSDGVHQVDGHSLPDWMFKLGDDLGKALNTSGDAKKVNTAQEVVQSLSDLVARGDMDVRVAKALTEHKGAVVWGVYNLIRNDMLMRHGIDRRTLQAQGLTFDDFTPTQGHLGK